MLATSYYTREDKQAINNRFKHFVEGICGYEPYMPFDTITSLAKALEVKKTQLYNIMYDKSNLTLDLLAIFQNKLGKMFDSRYIITGEKFVTKQSYELPTNYAAINKDNLKDILHNLEITKIKILQSLESQ